MTTTQLNSSFLYGSGFDGDVEINSSSFNLNDPWTGTANGLINNGVLQRDIAFNSLIIDVGCTLETNGYVIFVRTVLTNNGIIDCSGGNASTFTAGATAGQGSTLAGSTVGNTGTIGPSLTGGTTGYGGRGGRFVATTPYTLQGPGPGDPIYLLAHQYNGTTGGFWAGGGGANGAGNGVAGKGGGGGGGGGIVAIFAQAIDNTNGIIQANGGNGGGGGLNSNGGCGGGGGVIVLGFDNARLILGTLNCTGGSGGAGNGTGIAGNPGIDGNVFLAPGLVSVPGNLPGARTF